MIDANKCEYEESYNDSDDHYTVHYFTYPKDLSECEFYPEDDYGDVFCMCISLTEYEDGEYTVQMSPTVKEGDTLYDEDWRDLYEGDNYTEGTILKLLRKIPGRESLLP